MNKCKHLNDCPYFPDTDPSIRSSYPSGKLISLCSACNGYDPVDGEPLPLLNEQVFLDRLIPIGSTYTLKKDTSLKKNIGYLNKELSKLKNQEDNKYKKGCRYG